MKDEIVQSYQVLEIEVGDSLEIAKQAYRELVKVWHPDRFQNDPKLQHKAQEKLKQINAAYSIILEYLETAEVRSKAGFGTLAVLNSGFYEAFKNESFIADMKRLKAHCELLAIKELMGTLQVYAVVLGDDMSDENLIGRPAIIHSLAEPMKKYSMTMFKSRFGEAKSGVQCAMAARF